MEDKMHIFVFIIILAFAVIGLVFAVKGPGRAGEQANKMFYQSDVEEVDELPSEPMQSLVNSQKTCPHNNPCYTGMQGSCADGYLNCDTNECLPIDPSCLK